MINTIVSFTGTSLMKLFKNNNENIEETVEILKQIEDPETKWEAGADINSIVSIINNKKIDENEHLYLLTSDTKEGELSGEIIKRFFNESKKYHFKHIKLIKIEGLDSDKPHKFQNEGMRNSINEVAKIYKIHGNSISINATTGFKSVTAFAQIFASIMNIPVFYKFQKFPAIIELSNLPVSMDLKTWLINKDIFDLLEGNKTFTEEEIINEIGKEYSFMNLSKDLKQFIIVEKVDREKLYSLNALGTLYVNICSANLNLQKKKIELIKSTVPEEERLIFKNDEGHLKVFINKHHKKFDKLTKLNFIEKIKIVEYSLIYDKAKFSAKVLNGEIKLVFGNKGGKAVMYIESTAKTDQEYLIAIEKIKEVLA